MVANGLLVDEREGKRKLYLLRTTNGKNRGTTGTDEQEALFP